MSRYRKKNTRDNRKSMRAVSVVVVILLLVMSINIVRLYQKDQEYAQKEKSLKAEYETEQKRSEDLVDFTKFTQTTDYIEQVAREKLGLVFKNEIVFRAETDN